MPCAVALLFIVGCVKDPEPGQVVTKRPLSATETQLLGHWNLNEIRDTVRFNANGDVESNYFYNRRGQHESLDLTGNEGDTTLREALPNALFGTAVIPVLPHGVIGWRVNPADGRLNLGTVANAYSINRLTATELEYYSISFVDSARTKYEYYSYLK